MDHKIEHELVDNGSNGAPLGRQVTVSMSPEQYERMFFQPSPPRGDLSKRFANPTLMGLLGFLIPYTSTVLTLCGFQGATAPTTLIGLSGDYYFFGAIAMNLAGIAEFILGNTFPFAVFVIYGCHWGSLAYTQDPIHDVATAFASAGGATGAVYNSSQFFHNVTMCICSFVIFVATFRVNAFFTLLFFGLIGLFASIAAADAFTPHIKTEADFAHVNKLLHIAGGFGFIGLICGWYLAFVVACASVGIPCPLPILDLSTKVFPGKNKQNNLNAAEKSA